MDGIGGTAGAGAPACGASGGAGGPALGGDALASGQRACMSRRKPSRVSTAAAAAETRFVLEYSSDAR
jgi:hypothetical protein